MYPFAHLYNAYIEKVFKTALADKQLGIKVNGVNISNIRYTDDTTLLANFLQELQETVENINHVGKQYGLEINVKKTRFMIISREQYADTSLKINDELVQRISRFKHFGSVLDDECDDYIEIECRVAQAKTAY